MANRNKIEIELYKTDSGEFAVPKLSKVAQLLEDLMPGKYKLIIEKNPERLTRMKKYYFKMETDLANHLGYKKPELHEALKAHIGQKVDHDTGEICYESIKDIKDEPTMMQRIYEFQEYASIEHKFKFEPFYEEDRSNSGTIRLTADGFGVHDQPEGPGQP